jgi:hypothetical protein
MLNMYLDAAATAAISVTLCLLVEAVKDNPPVLVPTVM